jgi:CheY-like chemotaxis protein
LELAMHTILVVDDVALCRQFVAAALEHAGYKTVSAADGVEGLQQLEQNKIDLVVLDSQMPRMNGAAFLHALRADARFTTLPVILLTGSADRRVIVQVRLLGAQDYLLKTQFTSEELIVRVKRHLSTSTYLHSAAPSHAPGTPAVP